MSHNYWYKKLVSSALILAEIAFLFSFEGSSITLAQKDDKSGLSSEGSIVNLALEATDFIRQVRVLEIDRASLRNPAGLVFSDKGNAFHVTEMRQTSSAYTDFVKVTPFADRAGSARI